MKIKLVNSSSQPKHCFKVADRTDEGKVDTSCFWILEEHHDLFLFFPSEKSCIYPRITQSSCSMRSLSQYSIFSTLTASIWV